MPGKNIFFRDISDTEFFESYYERHVCFGHFSELGKKLQNILQNYRDFLAGLRIDIIGDLFIFKDGVACKEQVFFDRAGHKILWENIWQIYSHEYGTVYLRGLQKHCVEIRAVLKCVETHFPGKKLFANLFASPAHAVGLNAHFDPTDFFVFQVYGEKEWFLWRSPQRALAETMMPEEVGRYCARIQETQSPDDKIVLRQGQSLYVPLHTVHAPHTGDTASVHLTVGLADPALRNRLSGQRS